ncbi:hemerythrin domain-containing protein [Aquabacterium sp. A7-Y]|uniref:hemerythrin domain-containing protein n=1 Tax=Aquabacterium sp. A7-Y TaxID=1349605 RepID=UPI00223D7C38|nr:hemerythrin domain-containing protein [Aquabacterium sp. A7-Y]MCW7538751.1 hemerythrin domain-containing protein [Aquabacterium sp. A7-Y]
MLPGFTSPAAGFEAPFEMLSACHQRVERSLRLLQRLLAHLREHGCDPAARDAARDVLRYFDLAAPQHHRDEELHVFPRLLSDAAPTLREAVARLLDEHREMDRLWIAIRPGLQALADGSRTTLEAQAEADAARFLAVHEAHLATEERLVFPAARSRCDDTTLRAMGEEMALRRRAPR